ncbi:hypothetical protein CEE44_02215 [Candidatus Woesearchaeota archaeon B3_Woes]|nr:MAG: hypothetical protein CEE44_02215 [Candidatus Woesearchaeota archaeon B3_Woes]
MKDDEIIKAIYNAIDDVNELLPKEEKLRKEPNTPIFDVLSSLLILNFIVKLEENIKEVFNVTINLADELIVLKKNNPLKNVQNLKNHISSNLKNNQ